MISGKKIFHIFLPIFLIWLPIDLSSQAASNPFDLNHRLDKGARFIPDTVAFLRESRVEKKENPFDVIRPYTDPLLAEEEKPLIKKIEKKERIKVAEGGNFLFWIISVMLLILALSFSFYNSLFIKAYKAFLNDNILKLLHREQGIIISFPLMVLYVLFFINAGIFIFLVWRYYQLTSSTLSALTCFVGGTALVFICKHLLLLLLSAVFPISREIRQYSFLIVIFSIVLGMFLIPFNLFIAWAPAPLPHYLIYVALFMTGFIYIFRALRGLFLASNYFSFHKFHFFMYLCTVEIAPLIVLIKILFLVAGIQ